MIEKCLLVRPADEQLESKVIVVFEVEGFVSMPKMPQPVHER